MRARESPRRDDRKPASLKRWVQDKIHPLQKDEGQVFEHQMPRKGRRRDVAEKHPMSQQNPRDLMSTGSKAKVTHILACVCPCENNVRSLSPIFLPINGE